MFGQKSVVSAPPPTATPKNNILQFNSPAIHQFAREEYEKSNRNSETILFEEYEIHQSKERHPYCLYVTDSPIEICFLFGPSSVYRGPQVFEKLWPFMEAEINRSSNMFVKIVNMFEQENLVSYIGEKLKIFMLSNTSSISSRMSSRAQEVCYISGILIYLSTMGFNSVDKSSGAVADAVGLGLLEPAGFRVAVTFYGG